MTTVPDKLAFILGTQRSGTTWLANIIDASPDVLAFMEPLSSGCRLLIEFPDQAYFIRNSSPKLKEILQKTLPTRLIRGKYFLHRKSLISARYFKAERLLAKGLDYVHRFEPVWLQKRRRAFTQLNFNRFDPNFPVSDKAPHISAWAIKELRFSGKIPLLLSAFPDARYLVIIRHPAATVHSILTWMGQGNLGELRREMDTYIERIEVQEVAEPYRALIELCRDGSLAHKLALYWRISYEVMHRQLKDTSSARFVVYENLARDPQKTVADLFEWIGLPCDDSVMGYVAYSSEGRPKEVAAVTTVRDSARDYRSWCDRIDKSTLNAVLKVVNGSFLLPMIDSCYQDESGNFPWQ